MRMPIQSSMRLFLGVILLLVLFVAGAKLVRNYLIQQNELLVHELAQSVLPALLVDDQVSVNELLKSLESHPGVERVELVSSEGASIASLARIGDELSAQGLQFELASAEPNPDEILVMAPISFDSIILANLHIAVNLWPAYIKIMTWLGLLLMLPSVGYVLFRQYNIKIRFEKSPKDGGGDGGTMGFDLCDSMDQEMQRAQITVEFQPLHRLSDGGIFGVELVVCWKHASGQTIYVSPAEFAALAKSWGICLPVDEWVLKTACKQLAAMQLEYGPLVMSFNLSESQFESLNFSSHVQTIATEMGYPHQLIEFELSESCLSRKAAAVSDIQKFIGQGLNLTIDGFGLSTGCMAILESLSVNKIKLDSKLVANIEHDPYIQQFVQNITQLASANGLLVTADGVNTAKQRDVLKSMGCFLGQGRYFSTPLSATKFQEYVSCYAKERNVAADRSTQSVAMSMGSSWAP